ncbi:MAG: sortase [Chloroflexota bacterium]
MFILQVMSDSGRAEKQVIPFGVVLMVIGAIIVVAVVAIWVLAPSRMPRALYRLAEPYLGEETAVIPTLAAAANIPVIVDDEPGAARIPLTSIEPYTAYPDYFVSAADAVVENPHEGKPVRIVIPKIDVDAPVTEVTLDRFAVTGGAYYQWEVPEGYEAGWHNTSAKLGQIGNTVLNGHHNVFGEIFRDLEDLEEGDEIIIYDADRAYTYAVVEKEIFAERGETIATRLENSKWIEPTDDERITLITCWPYTNNTHRLVIMAKPIDS